MQQNAECEQISRFVEMCSRQSAAARLEREACWETSAAENISNSVKTPRLCQGLVPRSGEQGASKFNLCCAVCLFFVSHVESCNFFMGF